MSSMLGPAVRGRGNTALAAVCTIVVVMLSAAFTSWQGAKALTPSPVSTARAAAAVTATGLYANTSGLVMDAGGARKPGVRVVVQPDGAARGKRWLMERDGTIRPAYDTRLCLDVPRARYRAGVQLDVATCGNLKSQRFATSRSSASTPVFFISPVGDRKLCVSESSGFFQPGDAVTLDVCGPMLTAPGAEVWAVSNLSSRVGTFASIIGLGVAGDTVGSPAVAVQVFGLPLGSLWEVGTESVASYGNERVLRPLSNTALCLARAGTESAGTALRLEKCARSPAQAFMGITTIHSTDNPAYLLTEPDARFCVTIKGGAVVGHHAILGPCVGTAADTWTAATWTTGMDLTAASSDQYQELYTASGRAQSYSLGLAGNGAGAKAVVAPDQQRASQVWTGLPPSGQRFPGNAGNPDGSISLRPLSDTALCLTVPGARYVPGQQLAAERCDGKADQEFFRLPAYARDRSYQELIPYGDGRLCVGPLKGVKAGAPVGLTPCAASLAHFWSPTRGWYQNGTGATRRRRSSGGRPLGHERGRRTNSQAGCRRHVALGLG